MNCAYKFVFVWKSWTHEWLKKNVNTSNNKKAIRFFNGHYNLNTTAKNKQTNKPHWQQWIAMWSFLHYNFAYIWSKCRFTVIYFLFVSVCVCVEVAAVVAAALKLKMDEYSFNNGTGGFLFYLCQFIRQLLSIPCRHFMSATTMTTTTTSVIAIKSWRHFGMKTRSLPQRVPSLVRCVTQ